MKIQLKAEDWQTLLSLAQMGALSYVREMMTKPDALPAVAQVSGDADRLLKEISQQLAGEQNGNAQPDIND